MRELEETLEGHQGVLTRVRCFAHVLNLIVKAILSAFNQERSGGDDSVDDNGDGDDGDGDGDDEILMDTKGAEDKYDDHELDPAVHASDMAIVQKIVQDLHGREVDDDDEFSGSHELTDEERQLGRFALSKVRHLCVEHLNSPN
jgi:hypothetical protein